MAISLVHTTCPPRSGAASVIGGMSAALHLADAGLRVNLFEQTPCLAGHLTPHGYMFPQHNCILCRGTPDRGYGCTHPAKVMTERIHPIGPSPLTILTPVPTDTEDDEEIGWRGGKSYPH